MKVGVLREIKSSEYRVALTPTGVRELVAHGHEVYIEHDAGEGSTIHNEEYEAQGAEILATDDDVFTEAELILKVKEPQTSEVAKFRPGQLLFTYLHLAAYPKLADGLLGTGITAIAYETVQLPDRSLPLLAPMSEVAGRIGTQAGAYFLQKAIPFARAQLACGAGGDRRGDWQRFGDERAPCIGEGYLKPAAVGGRWLGRDQTLARQPLDNALCRGRIHCDEPAELVLRHGAFVQKLCKHRELARGDIRHISREYLEVPLIGQAQLEADLILKTIWRVLVQAPPSLVSSARQVPLETE